jgi:hypothetical protein
MIVPLRAELLKQSRQRSLLFWGFGAVPLFLTLIAVALEAAVPGVGGSPLSVEVHPIRSAMRALSVGGNPIAHLFFATGAAAIFCVEYRHASWRHIVPRASRTGLMTAKFAAYALFMCVSLVLLLAGDLLASLAPAVARGMKIVDVPPATLAGLAMSFLVSFVELLALGALVGLMAVLTRSTLGAIFPTFLMSLAAASFEAFLTLEGDRMAMVPLPTFAADAVRSWISAGPEGGGASGQGALAGGAILLAWTVVPFAAAVLVFRRQDLGEE